MVTEPASHDTKIPVVIIDNDSSNLELFSRILLQSGFQAYTAECANAGFELISSHYPQLVLLDAMMPEMDGLSALQHIKTRFPDSCVVIFVDEGGEESAAELMKNGASGYIRKPFDNRNLVDRLKEVLKVQEIERHNRELQKQQEHLVFEIEQLTIELQKRVREKSEELQDSQEKIVRSEKLAAIGCLSAGVAHEIRNPLNSIALFVQLMRQTTTEPEQLEYQAKIIKEIERIDSIIRKFLDSSRKPRLISTDVQINQVIDNVIEAFLPQMETRKIQVDRQFHCIPPSISADPTEIEQIFTNLFLNAMDAMSYGGRLEIELFAKDRQVVVRVGDSGNGIAEDILPCIFEPFFTTKNRGTGMGLPVAQRIVRMYDGSVEVEQSSPQGTVFRLEFPLPS